MPKQFPMVHVELGRIVVRSASALDESPWEESIDSRDMIKIVLARDDSESPRRTLHWFLQHRDGWTLHFHDGFEGALAVIAWLQVFGGFVIPRAEDVAGPGRLGTCVWLKESCA